MLATLLTSLLGLSGFLLAWHILKSKNRPHQPLVCPLSGQCATVVHSSYSKLVGLPLEIWGLGYYGLVTASYGVKLIKPDTLDQDFSLLIILLSTIAFLFSLYLTFIQMYRLHAWCTWCLCSAFLCSLIFALTIVSIG